MKITKDNLIYVLLLIVSLGGCFYLFTNLNDTRNVLSEYQSVDQLNQKFEQFLTDFSKGKHKQYLTGKELDKYTKAEKTQGQPSLEGAKAISKINFKQLYVKPLPNDRNVADSYGIMEIHYNFGGNNPSDQYVQTLSVNAHWIKVGKEWKVDKIDVSLLNDTGTNK